MNCFFNLVFFNGKEYFNLFRFKHFFEMLLVKNLFISIQKLQLFGFFKYILPTLLNQHLPKTDRFCMTTSNVYHCILLYICTGSKLPPPHTVLLTSTIQHQTSLYMHWPELRNKIVLNFLHDIFFIITFIMMYATFSQIRIPQVVKIHFIYFIF